MPIAMVYQLLQASKAMSRNATLSSPRGTPQ